MAGVDQHLDELLSAYLDGELGADELAQVAGHLETCLECVAEFRELQAIKRGVRTLPQLQLPDRLLDEVHVGEQLSAYIDGETDTAEQVVVLSHLGRCERCRDELHDIDAARTAVRSLPVLDPPIPLMPRLRHEPPAHPVRRAVTWAASVAAAAALVVGITVNRPVAEPIDLTSFGERHVARQSVSDGFQVVPAAFPTGDAP
ncbi:MAG: hypothetical protein HKN93_06565 [Acidimicrobiia bacterium]|nr:hypothetical protein [Acidimicrobiia bacterium]